MMDIAKKYYPHYNFDLDYVKINNYDIIKNILLKYDYINSLINNIKIDNNKYSELYITNTNLIINGSNNNDEKININLYELFHVITQNLSIEMPFIKYNDIEFNNPISVLNKDILNSIDMKTLKVWLSH